MKVLNTLDNLDNILDGETYKKVSSSEKDIWNGKQDQLTTQTSYSAKGSATKVPQITTNSLGQVTKVTEVTITQPTVNNATLTIQKNGTTVKTFTANASSNVTANITVPTKTSELTNDSSFATLNTVYPVGSIYMSISSTNPANLFGGTWEALGGRFLIGVNSTYTAGSTGGASTVTLTSDQIPSHSHSFTGTSHSHGLNSHKHSVGAHSHGLNSHTHSIGAHSHGLNSHTHSFSATTGSSGSHSHTGKIHTSTDGHYAGSIYDARAWSASGTSISELQITNSTGAHTHSVSGTTGAASGSTANSSSFTSGAASGSTANSTAFDSGAASGNTAGTTATGTIGSTGGGGSHNNMPPYLAVYMWKRTA